MLAAINNVAGKPPDRKVRPAKQHERQPNDDDNPAEQHQHFAEVGHVEILNQPGAGRTLLPAELDLAASIFPFPP